MRAHFAKLFAMLAAICCAGPASAATYTLTTANHPTASFVDVELWLGSVGGFFLTDISGLDVTGSGVADISLDGSNDGTVALASSSFTIEDIAANDLAIGMLGTVDVTSEDLTFSVTFDDEGVVATDFDIDSGTDGGLDVDGGTLDIDDVQGFIASFLDPQSFDFDTSPESYDFADLGSSVFESTTDDDSGLLDADGAEVNVPFDVAFVIGDLSGADILARFVGEIHIGSPSGGGGGSAAVVPEVGTVTMMLLGSIGMAGVVGVRRFRNRMRG